MSRTVVNLVIDLAAAVLLVGMIATGYLLYFPLPPGTNKALSLWGLTRHQWGEVHFWISQGLLGVLLLHVGLHWQWLVSVVRRRLGLSGQGRLLRSGLAALLGLSGALACFVWAAHSGVKEVTRPDDLGVCPPATVEQAGGKHAGPSPSPGTAGPDFWTEVYPILERSCLGCHGPRRQRGDFRVDRREDFFRPGRALVVPGDSAASPLIPFVSGTAGGGVAAHRLPGRDVALLKAWIDAGASWPPRAQ